MINGREEMEDYLGEQLTMYNYWNDPYEDPRHLSVQEMARRYNNMAGTEPNAELYETLIQEEFQEWYEALTREEELKEIADIVFVLMGYCEAKKYNFDEAYRRVYANNMERMYQDDGTIKRRRDGKVLKNPNVPKVNLEDCV